MPGNPTYFNTLLFSTLFHNLSLFFLVEYQDSRHEILDSRREHKTLDMRLIHKYSGRKTNKILKLDDSSRS